MIDGMVATITAHRYIIGMRVLGLFFRSHIKDPSAARDMLKTCTNTSAETFKIIDHNTYKTNRKQIVIWLVLSPIPENNKKI